jgi:hypothetical protein
VVRALHVECGSGNGFELNLNQRMISRKFDIGIFAARISNVLYVNTLELFSKTHDSISEIQRPTHKLP